MRTESNLNAFSMTHSFSFYGVGAPVLRPRTAEILDEQNLTDAVGDKPGTKAIEKG